MFWFIVGIIIGIIGIIAGVYMACDGERAGAIGCFAVGIILAVILIVASCIASIPTGHTGVVTTFGKVENYTLDAGFHLKAPWQKVVKMDNRVQKQTVDLFCFSADIQEVTMKYTINYQIQKANAMDIYKDIGQKYYETVIVPSVTESVKVKTALYTAENLVGKRSELAIEIEEDLRAKLLEYNIEIVSTSIEDMDFTDAFTNAVEAKQVAAQNKLKAQTEAEQRVIEAEAAAKVKKVEAEAAAEAAKINADAEAYQIKAKADAEAEANKKIADSLTGALIDYSYAINWDGKLPTFMSDGSGFVPVLNAQG